MIRQDWDETLYGPRKSVVEDESDITRLLMLRGSSFHDQLPELIVNGHVVAGNSRRPHLPADKFNLPIPKRPKWLRGVTDKVGATLCSKDAICVLLYYRRDEDMEQCTKHHR